MNTYDDNNLSNTLINNKYAIIKRIGSGSFGLIYKGQNIRTKEFVAIKIERINDNLKLLKNETKIYQYLKDSVGIPTIKWFGKDNVYYYMVINLLGKSLQEFKLIKGSFSLSLTLKLGIKMLLLIKNVHDKGLVHRDIKPDNFLFGPDNLNELYIIDFGFCKTYLVDNIHIPIKSTFNLIGSMNYASISSHNRLALSRRDDIESLCYVLLYFLYGKLPWSNENEEHTIIELKHTIIKDDSQCHPIINTLNYARTLKYEEMPDYQMIVDSFRENL